MKNILFAASEAVPFIKTGGLADVAGSLPKYFPKSDYDVRVILPRYMCMDQRYRDEMKLILECQVQLSWRLQYAGVYELELEGIKFYFIDNEYYFAGPAPYGQIYQDAEKFGYFCKAVLTVLPEIGFCPDIIHCHDWQTGLIPVFLEAQYRQLDFYHYIKTVYSIHNLKFQGRWYIDAIRDVTGLDASYFTMDTLESYGNANLLKGGVVFSDYVTTVSETYAQEIQSTDGGEGLDGLMRSRSFALSGIVNGLDYDVFNPATDELIAARFEGDIPSYKKANKLELQRSLGLHEWDGAFLIGMVSRLTDQKGFDLVDYILDEIMADDRIQLVVLGTGEQRYEDMFRFFAGKYPGRVSANIYYSEEIAHKIYASCDAFLMPSLFEPCGLSQLMSLRYGTVPMVRETGGLKDTVEAYNEFEHTGTGFSFHNYNAHEMLYMIRYACKIFYQYPQEWQEMIQRGMALDYSWSASSGKYAELYDSLISRAEDQRKEDLAREEERKRLEELRRDEELKARIRIEAELAREQELAKQQEEEKKTSSGRGTAKKTAAKKPAAKKTAAKKATARKSAAEMEAAEKKTAEDKPTAKKTTAKKTTVKTTAAEDPADKPIAQEAEEKKMPADKPAAKKTTAKKTATKETAPKKTSAKKADADQTEESSLPSSLEK